MYLILTSLLMKKLSFINSLLVAFVVFAFVATPIAPALASKDDHGNRGNHYGWYKQDWKNKGPFSNRNYFPLFGYGSTAGLEAYIKQLQDLLARLEAMQNGGSTASDINITTRSASAIDTDSATLRGAVAVTNSEDAEVYFEYGTNRNNLSKTSAKENYDTDTDYDISVSGLNEDTVYYFRAVGKDTDGNRDYGSVLSFRTTGENTNDEPIVTTKVATLVTDDSAELNGTVDMNDFDNGRVFFVYGTDDNAIDDVDTENKYADIDEDGTDLMKTEVDADLDSTSSYTTDISNLDDTTSYYFRIAVEYEDEDGDSQIEFGSVRSFKTDGN